MEENEGKYILDQQVGYLLRLANQRHSSLFQNVIPLGLTPTQFAALVRLADLGECSQNELGRRTAMDVATIKGVIERLRKKGLVEVNSDPNDKRRTILSIPDKKIEIVPDLHDAGRQISDLTLSPLTTSERNTLLRLLKKLG
ncbi:MarR family transcriptional regulator [Roseovarius sp. LXJ103]|uniref:MarR family winged helix-turn-helix transcriptional regulator n=1 Tax=Roseovarius carneus TaxID=2853164 RepID=UPI000D6174BA|nr:MarR family transcriptional regulator [Roseovarius carneus]MBZ8117033.1 MarR family transcriptional regulator [Roseovarius carneus]PWE37115.1 MarR family transcriptional regulator [Pelagicola sp. LXJ1103]